MLLCHTVFYSDGEIYIGQLKNYKRHGFGICRYTNGDVYNGWWYNGKCVDDMPR